METPKHWAEDLKVGDRVLATIRHKTDGRLNRHKVPIIVVFVNEILKRIIGWDAETETEIKIPFNELTK